MIFLMMKSNNNKYSSGPLNFSRCSTYFVCCFDLCMWDKGSSDM